MTNNQSDKLVITGGRLIVPSRQIDEQRDILIECGKIVETAAPGSFSTIEDIKIIDASNSYVTAGLVDIHVHFRDPGFEWKETITTGSNAAIRGGFTTVCCMPNTNPVNDCAQVTEHILNQIAFCKVLPIGAISVKQEGRELAPLEELQTAGCIAFSDDGYPVEDSRLMRRALEYSSMLGTVLTVHEEDKRLSEGFSMNESALSLKMGLVGMPTTAEDVMISRDIEIARLTKARVHFCHVSSARAVTLIERAKNDGIPVTAEVAPHHLVLDETRVAQYDTHAKMSMPLRSPDDVQGLLEGLETGVIDCIASDHAPHEAESKEVDFPSASFGITGLQTTVPLILGKVKSGELTLSRAIEALTSDAAKCLNLPANNFEKGDAADIAIINPEKSVKLDDNYNASLCRNTPFWNETLVGVATHTIVDGKEVFNLANLNN